MVLEYIWDFGTAFPTWKLYRIPQESKKERVVTSQATDIELATAATSPVENAHCEDAKGKVN